MPLLDLLVWGESLAFKWRGEGSSSSSTQAFRVLVVLTPCVYSSQEVCEFLGDLRIEWEREMSD